MNKFFLLIIAVIAISITSHFVIFSAFSEDVTATIKDKTRIVESNDSYYLIFTDEAVYKNADSILCMKFNSSNVYSDLEIGETYDMKVYGLRIPILSMYKNICKVYKN